MLLTEYFAKLVKDIEECSKTNLIVDSELHIDCRTEKIGIIKGTITFHSWFNLADRTKYFEPDYGF